MTSIKSYHSSLLDTVYFALGGVFGTLLILIGFSWWSNFKIYERDKDQLKSEVESRIKSLEATIELKSEEDKTQFEKSIEKRTESQIDRAMHALTEIRSQIRENHDSINTKISGLSVIIDSQKETSKKQSRSIAEVEYKLREVEENIWQIRKIPENLLITQAQGLEAAIESESRVRIKSVMSRIQETLKEYFVNGDAEMDVWLRKSVEDSLNKVPVSLGVEVSNIRKILDSIKVIKGAEKAGGE